MRYENVDLIDELQRADRAAAEQSRAPPRKRPTARRASSSPRPATTCASRCTRWGCSPRRLPPSAREPEVTTAGGEHPRSVEALEDLFAQLLDLSRLDAGSAARRAARTSRSQPLFARLAADFAPQAAATRTRAALVRHDARSSTAIRCCSSASCAISSPTRSATPSAGGVVVGARRRGSAVRIDVVDTGIGIAAPTCERIFDEFVQVAGAAPDEPRGGRGMGLGLAIVRRLCALLGHTLELASIRDRGSRFSIVVPRRAASRPDTVARRHRRCRSRWAPVRRPAHPVIDDDPAVVAAMRALVHLARRKRCRRRGCGVGARRLARERRSASVGADLIVADLRLADGASGLDAVAALRNALGHCTPALIVSGDTGQAARAEVRRPASACSRSRWSPRRWSTRPRWRCSPALQRPRTIDRRGGSAPHRANGAANGVRAGSHWANGAANRGVEQVPGA